MGAMLMPAAMVMYDSVTSLKGVGPALAAKLAKLDIHQLQDILFHLGCLHYAGELDPLYRDQVSSDSDTWRDVSRWRRAERER